jgi:predicted metal-dependent phosphoesterase TrpH
MICDHNSVNGAKALQKLLRSDEDFIFIPGIEVLTDRGEILGAWVEEDLSSYEFPAIVEEIRERGGVVVIPHPFDIFRRNSFRVKTEDTRYIDAVECFNSRVFTPRANKKATLFTDDNSLLKTAGSDAHFSPEVGKAWISFNGSTSEEFRQSLIKGKISIGGKRMSFFTSIYAFKHRLKRILL